MMSHYAVVVSMLFIKCDTIRDGLCDRLEFLDARGAHRKAGAVKQRIEAIERRMAKLARAFAQEVS